VLDVFQPIAHFIVAVKPESWHSAAGYQSMSFL
jgi:hypothetical protein